jgi:putative ABC transport system permease protein
VSQRAHEIGIRIALGAPPGRVRAQFVKEAMAPVLAGGLVGLAGAAAIGRLIRAVLAGAEPESLANGAAAAAALGTVAMAAMWAATARLTRFDPLVTLRSD